MASVCLFIIFAFIGTFVINIIDLTLIFEMGNLQKGEQPYVREHWAGQFL